ncbi:MAG: phage antirepressor KilAC domain-containing protein [Clostridia bacterium]|nr:phage antirepressor KilAC domain-containing protein [Clostridia bacterium]
MMSEFKEVFNYQGCHLRTIIKEGEIWFVAEDVCSMLEIDISVGFILDDDEKCMIHVTDIDIDREMLCFNESGLFTLFAGNGCEKVKKFKKWIIHEVIPFIRKTGVFNAMDQFEIPKNFPTALRLAACLAEENANLNYKAQQYDKFISAENLQSMGEVAKCLGMGRNKLFKMLREEKIFMSNNQPYQAYIDKGYFKTKERPIMIRDTNVNYVQTYVTSKGINYISKILWKTKRKIDEAANNKSN